MVLLSCFEFGLNNSKMIGKHNLKFITIHNMTHIKKKNLNKYIRRISFVQITECLQACIDIFSGI